MPIPNHRQVRVEFHYAPTTTGASVEGAGTTGTPVRDYETVDAAAQALGLEIIGSDGHVDLDDPAAFPTWFADAPDAATWQQIAAGANETTITSAGERIRITVLR